MSHNSLWNTVSSSTWTADTISISPISVDGYTYTTTNTTSTHPSLKVTGDAVFDGDIMIKGKSLSDSLAEIEKRLGILHINPDLESRWQLLKDIGDQYREIEKDLLKKEKMWEILKK